MPKKILAGERRNVLGTRSIAPAKKMTLAFPIPCPQIVVSLCSKIPLYEASAKL